MIMAKTRTDTKKHIRIARSVLGQDPWAPIDREQEVARLELEDLWEECRQRGLMKEAGPAQ